MTIYFSQFKYIILITIYVVCTTSCCKKYIIDNIGEENFYKSIKPCTNNKDFLFNKDVLSKINILENINTIYFDLDQYNILPEFYQILNQHADFLSKNTYCKIVIEGHADKRGTPEYNIALGERRANSVQTYLQSLGVMAQQMSIISYGKEKPASSGYKESDYANNRRVIIVYQTNN